MNEESKTIRELLSLIKTKHPQIASELDGDELLKLFPAYMPCSAGSLMARSEQLVKAVNQVPLAMLSLAKFFGYANVSAVKLADQVPNNFEKSADLLKMFFDKHGSDKASVHNYHLLYAQILSPTENISNIFEIGLGTNNTSVVSNMGLNGRPGASLRAFRDFLPNAEIYGADVDRGCLFSEERIKTFHLDQTDRTSFENLSGLMPTSFDLMIDDGLHSPNANLHSLEFFLSRIRVGGWAVVEDIGVNALPLWEIVARIMPAKYRPVLLQTKAAFLFAVQKVTD